MEHFSYKQSLEASKPVAEINQLAFTLNIEYLEGALKELTQVINMRDSAAVLNPSPFTHNEQQDLNRAKNEQLRLMIELAKNAQNIKDLTIKLGKARANIKKLNNFFNFIDV